MWQQRYEKKMKYARVYEKKSSKLRLCFTKFIYKNYLLKKFAYIQKLLYLCNRFRSKKAKVSRKINVQA